jgi:hypothetical protein
MHTGAAHNDVHALKRRLGALDKPTDIRFRRYIRQHDEESAS